MMQSHIRTERWIDGSAFSLSFACMIHCLTLPLLLSFAPALGLSLIDDGLVHSIFLVLAIPVSLLGFLGFRRRRDWRLAAMALLGLALMYLGLESHGALSASAITLPGVMLVALAHGINWRRRALQLR